MHGQEAVQRYLPAPRFTLSNPGSQWSQTEEAAAKWHAEEAGAKECEGPPSKPRPAFWGI